MQAHDADDRYRLSALYHQAGQLKEASDDVDAACFLYTQSYVYGLDSGNESSASLARVRLVAHGREQ